MAADTFRVASAIPHDAATGPSELKQGSAVSWAAIMAGALGAAALSLILLVIGTGLGLSSMSPWTGQGAAAATLGLATILWVSFTQFAAAGMGGYLAGRLRSRWHATHTDEVYFRDTAHGFLAWALATLVTAAFLASTIASIVSGSAQVGAAAVSTPLAGAAMAAAKSVGSTDDAAGAQRYFVDTLFRSDSTTPPSGAASSVPGDSSARSSGEVARIFAAAIGSATLPADDLKYVAQLVAQRTGMPQSDAEKRVTDVFARMREQAKQAELAARDAADKARKASAYSALWLSVSLLIGAFCASFAATVGGRQRDQF